MIRKCLAIGIILLFVGVTIAPAMAQNAEKSQSVSQGNWLYVGGSGPGNYTAIQSAINDAGNGDTVFVYSGTYYENVVVNRTIDLIGENRETTVIDGMGFAYVVKISSDGVAISGFTMLNSTWGFFESGIILDSSSNSMVTGNNVANNTNGILLYFSSNNIITGNNVANNEYGISLERSSSNTITGNNANSNYLYGIGLRFSSNNTVTGNNANFNIYTGIRLDFSSNNNKITGNNAHFNIEHGIALYSSSNTVMGNNASNTSIGDGIAIYSSSNTVTGNNANSNFFGAGIRLSYSFSSSNTVTGNNVANNYYGIFLDSSSNNTICKNNFIKNRYNAFFKKSKDNSWNQNYWDRPRILPKLIFGTIFIRNKTINWFNIDWHPALKRYDISCFCTKNIH